MVMEQNISCFMFGMSTAFLIRNILYYWQDCKYAEPDSVCAMTNWHFGFLLVWISFCTGVAMLPDVAWYYGAILIPFFILATYAFWYPIDLFRRITLLARKDDLYPPDKM